MPKCLDSQETVAIALKLLKINPRKRNVTAIDSRLA